MKKVVYSLLLVSVFFSCSKQEISSENLKIESVNGILKFQDLNHFEQIQNSIRENSLNKNDLEIISSFNSFEKEIKQELTLKQKQEIIKDKGSNTYHLFQNSENEIEARPQVNNLLLRKLLNKNGLVLIGKNALKVEFEREILFSNFNPLSEIVFNNYGNLNSSIKLSTKNLKIQSINSALPQNDSRHHYFRKDLRLKVRYDYDGFTPYPNFWNSVQVWAELQDRFGGIWWNRTADAISVNASGAFGLGLNYQPNNNSAVLGSTRIGTCCGSDLYFWKQGNYSFTITAWCKENGGDYEASVSVTR